MSFFGLLSAVLTVGSFVWGVWKFFKKTKSSERFEERLRAAEENEKGLKNAINVAQKHEAEKINSPDIDNLRGL